MMQQNIEFLNKANECFQKGQYEYAISYYIQVMQTDKYKYKYFCEYGIQFAHLGQEQQAIENFIKDYNYISVIDLAQYLKGLSCHYIKSHQDAISNLTSVLQRCPQFKFCFNDRGNIHLALQQLEQAIKDYTEAIKLDDSFTAAYCNRGSLLDDLGRKEDAIKDYTKAIQINPQFAEAYYNRGVSLSNLGRREDAIKDFNKAIEINPQFAEAYYNRGVSLSNLGRREDAIKDFNKAIEINPQFAQAYYNRGVSLNNLGRREDAIKDYTKATEINPKLAQAYCNRGNSLNNLGRKEDAIKDYTKAIEINPQFAEAYYNRGNSINNLGRKEDAIRDYTKAIEINPQHAEAFNNRGNLLDDLGRKDDAIKDYTKAIEINPQFAEAYCNRGGSLIDLGRKDDAIKEYTKAIEINPKLAQAYYNRGVSLSNLGRREDAIKDFNKAIEINPQFAQAYYNRGVSLNNLGRREDAIKDYTKAIEINPKLAQAYCNRGNSLNNLGRKEDALKDYLKAHQIMPQDPLYNVQLGQFHFSNNEKKKALDYFSNAQKIMETITQQDLNDYHLSEANINYIKQKVKLIQQIEQDISKVNLLIKSNTITKEQQDQVQEKLVLIEDDFNNQLNQPIDRDEKKGNNDRLLQLEKQMKFLIKRVTDQENQKSSRIHKMIEQLKKDKNRHIYYKSLYWRLSNYIQECQLLYTNLFQKHPNALIETDSESYTNIALELSQQVSNIGGSTPIVGSEILIITTTLEFVFGGYLNYKLNQYFIKLTQIVQRCNSKNEIDEEIQLAVIEKSKKLPEIQQDLQEEQCLINYIKQIWKTVNDQKLLINIKKICDIDINQGNENAQNPYWKLGIVDTLNVLHNLLLNQEEIQKDENKELHLVILDSFNEKKEEKEKKEIPAIPQSGLSKKCYQKICQIQ